MRGNFEYGKGHWVPLPSTDRRVGRQWCSTTSGQNDMGCGWEGAVRLSLNMIQNMVMHKRGYCMKSARRVGMHIFYQRAWYVHKG